MNAERAVAERLIVLALVVSGQVAGCADPPRRRPPPAAAKPAASAQRPADDAQQSMDLGAKLQSQRAFAEAAVAFEQAYRLGHDPRALFGAAQCYRTSHKAVVAYETYERILAEHGAELSAQQRQTVQRALTELGAQTGALVVNVSEPDADVELDGKTWGRTPTLKHHRLSAGTHVVRVTKAGFSVFEAEVAVVGGESKVLEAKLVPDKAPSPNDMPEAERRSAARAAFEEGVELQGTGKCADALQRFRAAQRLYEAPTHLLHVAQCLVATGKLLDARETYESLTHLNVDPQAPAAFTKAVETARTELAAVKARVPTLRLETQPPPSALEGLQVQVNGVRLPTDLLGVARPMNPGTYRVEATAGALHGTAEIELKERNATSLQLHLVR
jgi:tetratricopeptide (TPR) repeat protein